MKNSNGFIFVLLVLCIVGGIIWFGKDNKVVDPNNNFEYQEPDTYEDVKNEEIVEKEKEVSQTKVVMNSQVYNFTDSICHIGGQLLGGKKTWSLSINLNNELLPKSKLFFVALSSGNTIDSYLQKNTNLSDNGVTISNRLSSSSYSTGIINDIQVVWKNINRVDNSFSGDGYITFNKEIKPHQDVCDGKTMVNGKYLTPSDPFYSTLCPSDIFPVQTIYFKCDNGIINTKIGIPQTTN